MNTTAQGNYPWKFKRVAYEWMSTYRIRVVSKAPSACISCNYHIIALNCKYAMILLPAHCMHGEAPAAAQPTHALSKGLSR